MHSLKVQKLKHLPPPLAPVTRRRHLAPDRYIALSAVDAANVITILSKFYIYRVHAALYSRLYTTTQKIN